MPLAGKMAAVLPLDWVYQGFFSIFLIGSIICGLAHTSNALIAGRAIAGFGGAGVASNGLAILLAIAPTNKKPLLMALGACCFAIGLILAPVLGGVFTQKLSWRWCFWINLPPGAVSLVVVFFFFKPPRPMKGEGALARLRSLDLFGCLLFIPAILMLLLAMQRGGAENNWNTPTIIGLFVGGGAMLILFIAWENWKGDGAMMPRRVVGRRTVICTVLLAFCHVGSLTVTAYYLPEWFQAVQGVGPLQSGIRMLATVAPQLAATIASSSLGK
jgi:MFS family permease